MKEGEHVQEIRIEQADQYLNSMIELDRQRTREPLPQIKELYADAIEFRARLIQGIFEKLNKKGGLILSINRLRRAVEQLEKEQEGMINSEMLTKQLQRKRDNHSDQALMVTGDEQQYQEGFADGLQEAMNTIVGLIDARRLN